MPHKDINKRREYQRKYQSKWRKDNKKKWKNILKKSDKKRYETNKYKLMHNSVGSRRHHRNKIKVLMAYGTQCAYCSENKYELLVVDHIKNNGTQHRQTKKFRKYRNIYAYLAKTEFRPDLYQILCFNCNMAKQLYAITPNENTYKSLKEWQEYAKLRNKKL